MTARPSFTQAKLIGRIQHLELDAVVMAESGVRVPTPHSSCRLPLETVPYSPMGPDAPLLARDEDGWAPVPASAEVRREGWDALMEQCQQAQRDFGDPAGLRRRTAATQRYYDGLVKQVDGLREADMLTKATGDFAGGGGEGLSGANFIFVSMACNLVIFVVKAFAAVSSGSLVLLASALDSLLDLASGTALSCVAALMRKEDKYKFPVGKTRMEPLGVIVFATLMGSCSLQVLAESVKRLLAPEMVELTVGIWAPMLAVICVKAVLFIVGRRYLAILEEQGKTSDACEAQKDDHRLDVLTNTLSIVGAFCAGSTVARFLGLRPDALMCIDPIAAILFSLYVIKNWGATALEQMTSLVGKVGPPDLHRKITFLAATHCQEIIAVDTVRTFSFGPRFIAEVDVVLPPDMTMRVAHDIGESLQIRIENLSEVERCYVHLDWETDHKPEHKSTE